LIRPVLLLAQHGNALLAFLLRSNIAHDAIDSDGVAPLVEAFDYDCSLAGFQAGNYALPRARPMPNAMTADLALKPPDRRCRAANGNAAQTRAPAGAGGDQSTSRGATCTRLEHCHTVSPERVFARPRNPRELETAAAMANPTAFATVNDIPLALGSPYVSLVQGDLVLVRAAEFEASHASLDAGVVPTVYETRRRAIRDSASAC
jgi:hypothetical protein